MSNRALTLNFDTLILRLASLLLLLTLLLALAAAARGADDEAERGKQAFDKRCTSCHALDRNKKGPRLGGVYGRQAGTEPGFKYSKALKNAGFVWNAAQLDRWLTDTESVVRHNNMDFAVARASERAAIIQYLKENSPQTQSQSQPKPQ